MRDQRLIYAATFLRALATGMISILLGIYLIKLQFNVTQIGWVITAGLSGAALAALLTTLWGDRLGRRRLLIVLSFLGAMGGLASALVSDFQIMLLAAFVGMVNGMGKDRGAMLILENAILPSLQRDTRRTQAFAWYSVVQDIGHALGALLAGLPTLISYLSGAPELVSFRSTVVLYSLLIALTAVIYLLLSPAVEVPMKALHLKISEKSKSILWKISSLFALDSIAGGFLTAALLSYFFYERFGAGAEIIGLLFFAGRVLNALSHLGAAWLSKRIGLVNTMVFTHIPSSLLLVTVVFAPNFFVAAVLFLLREAFVEMDVPTRQSYLMAVVAPEERTLASGVTHIVRMAGWAIVPMFAGTLMDRASLGIPIFIGAAMKITYDLLLYRAFRHTHPPEEKSAVGVRPHMPG